MKRCHVESSMSEERKKPGRKFCTRSIQLSVMVHPSLVPLLDDTAASAGLDRADIVRQLVEGYAFRKAREEPGKYPAVDVLIRVRDETAREAYAPRTIESSVRQ